MLQTRIGLRLRYKIIRKREDHVLVTLLPFLLLGLMKGYFSL